MLWEDVDGLREVAPGRVYALAGNLKNMTYRNSRIVLTDKPVYFNNVRFVDCVFEPPFSSNPPSYLRQAGQQLLEAGIGWATLNTGI
jgi:hypothetical protein